MLFQKPMLFDEKPKHFLQLTWQMFDHIPMYHYYTVLGKKVQVMPPIEYNLPPDQHVY